MVKHQGIKVLVNQLKAASGAHGFKRMETTNFLDVLNMQFSQHGHMMQQLEGYMGNMPL